METRIKETGGYYHTAWNDRAPVEALDAIVKAGKASEPMGEVRDRIGGRFGYPERPPGTEAEWVLSNKFRTFDFHATVAPWV